MIHAAKELMASGGWTPDFTGWKPDANEAKWDSTRDNKLYEYGAKDANGDLAHSSLDTVVKHISDQKVRDHGRMKKWQTKIMTGFK
jgi:hypothetical protein